MTTALHFLGVLFMLGTLWFAGGIVLFSPAPGGRPGVLPERYFGWWVFGFWGVAGGVALFAWLTS